MKNIIIVDIDGTISKVGDRLKYLQQEPKDWDSFYEHCDKDEQIIPICDLITCLFFRSRIYDIVFCTGRRESVREKTKTWLSYALFDDAGKLPILMRKNGDFRHDTEVKPELLKEAGITVSDVAFILEDRTSMVKKWRELGFICLQVADGDF